MRLRRALYPAVALGLAATLPAVAAPAPKPACNLLVDEEGDGDWLGTGVVSSPAMDIISGDVATGAKQIVGVLRLKSLDFTSQNFEELGHTWTLAVTAKGTKYVFEVRRTAGVNGTFTGAALEVGGTPVPAKDVAFKVIGNSLEWRVPRAGIKTLGQPKLVFDDFRGTSEAMSQSADAAITDTSRYPDRYPSCAKPL